MALRANEMVICSYKSPRERQLQDCGTFGTKLAWEQWDAALQCEALGELCTASCSAEPQSARIWLVELQLCFSLCLLPFTKCSLSEFRTLWGMFLCWFKIQILFRNISGSIATLFN
jgi:hypothetical protein